MYTRRKGKHQKPEVFLGHRISSRKEIIMGKLIEYVPIIDLEAMVDTRKDSNENADLRKDILPDYRMDRHEF